MTLPIGLRAGLSAALLVGACGHAFAQHDPASVPDRIHGPDHEHETLEEIIVTATPLRRDVVELSQSATVLSGAALERELANNIGDTLSRMPGLANASFGENVGRPVIRGLQGARIGVLANNMTSSDASAVSQDHAVPVEPFLADQVEVLRGPATLLYGSGAIGGVVNVVSHTIPQEVPDAATGRAMMQFDSAADQRFGAARLDFGASSFAFHANAFMRRTDDYEIPGMAELETGDDHLDEHDDEHEGEHDEEDHSEGALENSFLDNEGGSVGASWIGQRWRTGLSWSGYDSDYGIPGAHGHAHEEEDGHDDEHGDEEEHDEDGHGEEEENVTIGLRSRRVDGEIVGQDPFSGFDRLMLKVALTDYEHTEFEGEEIGTVFTNDTTDARLELRHRPWGRSEGAFGAQYTDRDFSAVGEEAFVPSSTTQTASVFWVESMDFDDWQLDVGARYEDVDIEADEHALPPGADSGKRGFKPFSLSAGAVWHVDERSHLAFNVSRAERAPTDQELFAFGPHLATQTFEVGGPGLGIERNLHVEAGYRVHEGALTGSLTVYADFFSDYIFQSDTGLEEDGLPLREWSQQDAEFWGGELELRYDAGEFESGHWQLFGFADAVRGEFDDGGDVPRLPPWRIGAGVDWDLGGWAASLNWIHAARQDHIAAFETETPGYDRVDLEASYLLPAGDRADWEIFVKARNLLDEEIRNSTSYLKDQAPQIGRNFVVGMRVAF